MASWVTVLICVLSMMTPEVKAQAHVIEAYFVTDYEAVMSYVRLIPGTASFETKKTLALANMNKDIDYILTEINQLLATLSTYGLNIELRLRKLDILNSNVIPGTSLIPKIPNGVDCETALTTFGSWLSQQKAYSTLKYDLAILWTGYEIYDSLDISTAGYAHVAEVCDSKVATGVVEFTGTYETAIVTAHEIGHILGANHGGANLTVMSDKSSPDNANRWFFSQISASEIKKKLASLAPNCLLTTNPSSTKPSTTYASYTGSILDPEINCQRSLNNSATYMCKDNTFYSNSTPTGDKVCSHLFCSLPGKGSCTSTFAPEGMVCDASKRCNNGKCVADTSAPASVDPKCIWGDQKVVEVSSTGFVGNCTTYLAMKGPSGCYNSFINQRCCASCKPYYTGRAGCEYGDRTAQCVQHTKANICPVYGTKECCNYCYGFIGKRSTNKDDSRDPFHVPLVPSLSVEDLVVEAMHAEPFVSKRWKVDNIGE